MGTLICSRRRPTTNTVTTMHKNNNNINNMKKRVRLELRSSMMMMVALLGLVMAPISVKGQLITSLEYALSGILVDDAAVDAFAQVILESGGVFEGDVKIGESVTSLKGLEGLNSVGGYLRIYDNGQLTSLDGLEGLTSVDGDLEILSNDQLTSFTGLEGLTSVGGSFEVMYNALLTSLAGLEGLTSVDGDLDIDYNDQLTSLAGLTEVVEGEVDITLTLDNDASAEAVGDFVSSRGGVFPWSLDIAGNITSLEKLESLSEVQGNLWISTDQLTSLVGLEGLTSVGGYLRIWNNAPLMSLTGLEGLTSVGGDLYINENAQLTSLAGFEGLTSGGGNVDILGNDQLTSLAGLEGLNSVGGSLFIENNTQLLFDAGLESVMKVGGYVDPGSLDQSVLQAVASLPNLADEVDVVLKLDTDASVLAVGGFVAKRGGVFPESLEITGEVTSLASLSGLTSVGVDLYIGGGWFNGNPRLTSLDGLESVAQV